MLIFSLRKQKLPRLLSTSLSLQTHWRTSKRYVDSVAPDLDCLLTHSCSDTDPPCLQRGSLPKFLIRGHLDATNCVISQPLTGEVVVENSDIPIKSIELQLVRVETCGESMQPNE